MSGEAPVWLYLALGALVAVLVVVLLVGAVAGLYWIRQQRHRQRIERRQAGLPEVPRDQQKRRATEPLPEDIREVIGRFDSPGHRLILEEDIRALRADGVPFKEISRMLEAQLQDE